MKETSHRTPQKVGLLACGFLCSSVILAAGENRIPDSAEISSLKAQLAYQQEQIDQLRKELQAQRILILQSRQAGEKAPNSPPGTSSPPPREAEQIASLSPAFPKSSAPTVAETSKQINSALPDSEIKPSPLSIGIGSTQISPVGFLDLTGIYRSKNVGSGLGTNFGAIPFNNSVDGNLSETRLSAQNSRLGARLDTKIFGVNVLNYLKTDFLKYTPKNAAVTSHSDGLRLRLYWVKLRKSKFEILARQS